MLLSAGTTRLLVELLTLPVSVGDGRPPVQTACARVLGEDLSDTSRVLARYRDMLAEAASLSDYGVDPPHGTGVDTHGGAADAWTRLKSDVSRSPLAPHAPVIAHTSQDLANRKAPALRAHTHLLLGPRANRNTQVKP